MLSKVVARRLGASARQIAATRYLPAMRTITHSDLRNNSARILREAEAGETMLITNRGKTVAVIGPPSSLATSNGPRLVRPATRTTLEGINPVQGGRPTAELIDELRGNH